MVRPRKCSLAKANPASAHSTPWATPIVPATMRLFSSDWRNGTVVSTSRARCRKFPPGTTSGGSCVAVALSVVATTNIQ